MACYGEICIGKAAGIFKSFTINSLYLDTYVIDNAHRRAFHPDMENTSNTLKDTFFAPVFSALSRAKNSRACSEYSDCEHLNSAIQRVLETVTSGRDWVQRLRLKLKLNLSVSNFFSSLRSERRKDLVEEVSTDVKGQTDQDICHQQGDPLAVHPELDGFAVYASDGHSHKASAHETPIQGKKRAVAHIYTCNLRSHSLTHTALTNTDLSKGKKKEHEITTLKQIGANRLRMGEAKGIKWSKSIVSSPMS